MTKHDKLLNKLTDIVLIYRKHRDEQYKRSMEIGIGEVAEAEARAKYVAYRTIADSLENLYSSAD